MGYAGDGVFPVGRLKAAGESYVRRTQGALNGAKRLTAAGPLSQGDRNCFAGTGTTVRES